ncbi:MAG: MBL fold metallo-hydrolase [Lachnospiraceae bacterium]|jgi:hydroxyacylglutathione hydrolase
MNNQNKSDLRTVEGAKSMRGHGGLGVRKRPEPLKEAFVTDCGNGIFNITSPPMRFQQYLVIGKEKALLIDTGFGLGSLKKIIDGLTSLPIILLNTHGHPDHGGGNEEFGSPLLHPADSDLYFDKCSYEYRKTEMTRDWQMEEEAAKIFRETPAPIPVEDGTIIDLGERKLTVIHTPGHTRGSVCVWDEQTRNLFAGDNIQPMTTALTEESAADLSTYIKSLKRLKEFDIQGIYGGHFQGGTSPDLIDSKIKCAEKMLSGDWGKYMDIGRNKGYIQEVDGTSICCAPEKMK